MLNSDLSHSWWRNNLLHSWCLEEAATWKLSPISSAHQTATALYKSCTEAWVQNKPYKEKTGLMHSPKVQMTSRSSLPFSVGLTRKSYSRGTKTPTEVGLWETFVWWWQHFHGNLLMFLQSRGNFQENPANSLVGVRASARRHMEPSGCSMPAGTVATQRTYIKLCSAGTC